LFIVFLVLSLLKILFTFNNPILNNILLGVSIVIGILAILNFFNKVGNKSPGATDNATSVGTVIALSKYFKNNPLENIDFTFLITGSEELNLGGAIDFIQKHKNELDKDITYFINYDLVGALGVLRNVTSHGIPKKTTSTKLNELFRNIDDARVFGEGQKYASIRMVQIISLKSKFYFLFLTFLLDNYKYFVQEFNLGYYVNR
ncbi:unnamed protein product, partial [marine sediment metagenome]